MAGCWRGDGGVDRSIEEHWTAADSDVMLATTRYLDDNDGHTRGWEFSRIPWRTRRGSSSSRRPAACSRDASG